MRLYSQREADKIPQEMSDDDYGNVAKLPIVIAEYQPNNKRTHNLAECSVTKMQQSEQHRRNDDGNVWVLEKHYETWQ